jgi:membrane protein implicated in regulation of membrane protease activity
MTTLKPQTALGGFALLTLLLAGAAIGRLLGISVGYALYLTLVALVMVGWLGNRMMLRRGANSSEEQEA